MATFTNWHKSELIYEGVSKSSWTQL